MNKVRRVFSKLSNQLLCATLSTLLIVRFHAVPLCSQANEDDTVILMVQYDDTVLITYSILMLKQIPLCFIWKVTVQVGRDTDVLTLPSGQFVSRQSSETCFLRAGRGELSLHSCNSALNTDHFHSVSFYLVKLSQPRQELKCFTSH